MRKVIYHNNQLLCIASPYRPKLTTNRWQDSAFSVLSKNKEVKNSKIISHIDIYRLYLDGIDLKPADKEKINATCDLIKKKVDALNNKNLQLTTLNFDIENVTYEFYYQSDTEVYNGQREFIKTVKLFDEICNLYEKLTRRVKQISPNAIKKLDLLVKSVRKEVNFFDYQWHLTSNYNTQKQIESFLHYRQEILKDSNFFINHTKNLTSLLLNSCLTEVNYKLKEGKKNGYIPCVLVLINPSVAAESKNTQYKIKIISSKGLQTINQDTISNYELFNLKECEHYLQHQVTPMYLKITNSLVYSAQLAPNSISDFSNPHFSNLNDFMQDLNSLIGKSYLQKSLGLSTPKASKKFKI